MKEGRCKETLWDAKSWHQYQCSRKATKDGYCKQHHPDSVAERQRKSEAAYEEKRKKEPWFISNGRFGHPEQDRAITIREAARLQGFPNRFIFTGSLSSMARQIGNAVPVPVARAFGRHFVKHVKNLERKNG